MSVIKRKNFFLAELLKMECFPLWGGKFLANVSVEADAEWVPVRTGW